MTAAHVPGFGVEVSAGEIGLGLTGAAVAGVTAHGLIKMIKPAPKPPEPVKQRPVEHGKGN